MLDFESLWQFLFCGSTITTSVSYYIIKPTDLSVVACDWLASAVKPIRSKLSLLMAKHGSHFSFGVSSSKGTSEEEGERNENKNRSEKLKANRSRSKERKFVPKHRRKNLFGEFAMTTWATTMPVLTGILKQFLCLLFLLGGGGGGQGCQIQSVINEHFKRPNWPLNGLN